MVKTISIFTLKIKKYIYKNNNLFQLTQYAIASDKYNYRGF